MNEGLWRHLTTTVGLVTSGCGDRINVMAAEWTYFVNKDPLYIAVGLSRRSVSRELILHSGELSVTLCSESQAEAANFAGSFSGRDIDKTSSEAFVLRSPTVTSTPWVAGGLAAFECVVRRLVRLPDYHLFVAEAVAAHVANSVRPLVKHTGMYALGDRLDQTAVVAAAQLLGGSGDEKTLGLRVAATGQSPDPRSSWRLALVDAAGDALPIGEYPPDEFGDLMVDVEVRRPIADRELSACRVRVERDGLKPGWTRVSTQPPLRID